MATNTNLVAPFNPPPPTLGFRCRICLHNRVVLDRETLAHMKSHLGCFHHLGPWYCSICGHTDGRADHVAKHITTACSTINHTTAVPRRDVASVLMLLSTAILLTNLYVDRLSNENNPATLEDCMIMEDELQGEMARVEYAQNATEVCSAVSNALVILRYYRELMQEEGDKDEITNIDEDVMNLSRVKRSAARLVDQGL